ncbi:MAG: hypothetical protein IIZ39_04175 [Blautia sp.]|nr:hypothetical protein [Blautia sp.]
MIRAEKPLGEGFLQSGAVMLPGVEVPYPVSASDPEEGRADIPRNDHEKR